MGTEYRVVFDHAKQHTGKFSKRELAEMNVPVMPDFPAQCWDLNIIEVAWAWLMHKLRGHNPRTWDGWKRVIKKAWNEVEISHIDMLVDKVPKQLHGIIQANGEWVKYFP